MLYPIFYGYIRNSDMGWKVIVTSAPKVQWVWYDYTKYKELSCNILLGDETYASIYIPTIYITSNQRTFMFNSGKTKIVVDNESLYFDGEGDVMAVIAR